MARARSSVSRSCAIFPSALRCEYRVDPIGISETRPRLNWTLLAAGVGRGNAQAERGLSQKAYQIRVASTREKLAAGHADLWDSQRVASRETVFVEYGGVH